MKKTEQNLHWFCSVFVFYKIFQEINLYRTKLSTNDNCWQCA